MQREIISLGVFYQGDPVSAVAFRDDPETGLPVNATTLSIQLAWAEFANGQYPA